MISIIEKKYEELKGKFTKSDLKLIEYFNTANHDEIVYQSITELSELSGVGEATILRFCRKLGLKGYQEFKLVLAQELAIKNKVTTKESYVEKIADNMINSINETKDLINMDVLSEAVDQIVNSKKQFFFGLGNSGLAAVEAKNRLMRIGFHVDAITDPHFMAMITSTLTEEDVIVLVSISGSTKDIIDVAKLAHENNVKVIVITNYAKSPITKYADLIIYTVRNEGPLDGGSLISKISQLYAVDILCTGITLAVNGEADQMLEKTARAVVNKIV